MAKTQQVKEAVAANPVTTTAGIGAIVVLIGVQQGWSTETTAQVSTAVVFLMPVVRAVVYFLQNHWPKKA